MLTGHFKPQTKAPDSLIIEVNYELSVNLMVRLVSKFEQADCPQRPPAEAAQTLASQLADTIGPAVAEALLTGAGSKDIEDTLSSQLSAQSWVKPAAS